MARDMRDYINPNATDQHDTPGAIRNAFIGDLLDDWTENDWQGRTVAAFKLEKDLFAVISGYFGSCTYCDPIMGSCEADKADMIRSWVNSARTFESREELREWVNSGANDPSEYSHSAATNLSV